MENCMLCGSKGSLISQNSHIHAICCYCRELIAQFQKGKDPNVVEIKCPARCCNQSI